MIEEHARKSVLHFSQEKLSILAVAQTKPDFIFGFMGLRFVMGCYNVEEEKMRSYVRKGNK